MILTDAGPLIALVDENDQNHMICKVCANQSRHAQMLSTWPCFTEAMHLLYVAGDYRFQRQLWALLQRGGLVLADLTGEEVIETARLMERYSDRPMDLADASLVALAEARGFRQVFTLDSDFHIYRLRDGSVLEVVP